MSELGGFEFTGDQEHIQGNEQLSEQAKEQFAANLRAIKQIRAEEKQAKKKDDALAAIIAQFLAKKQYSHLFTLISRLVARNCPSVFVLAVLSLIHADAKAAVEEYLAARYQTSAGELASASVPAKAADGTDLHALVLEWITRVQMTLESDSERILHSLMIDERNIDGTLLQLCTFVVQDFYKQHNQAIPFEQAQPLTASLLQSVISPYLAAVQKRILEEKAQQKQTEE